MLLMLVRRVASSGCAVLCASNGALFLNENVRDEVVDYRGANSCVVPGPEDDPGRVDDLEGV